MIAVYRVDIVSQGRASSRSWVDAPNVLVALVKALLELRRHRRLTHKPVIQFTLTREFV